MIVDGHTLVRFHREWKGGERYWVHSPTLGSVRGEVWCDARTRLWFAQNAFHQPQRGHMTPQGAVRELIGK